MGWEFMYCQSCNEPMPAPTDEEALFDEYKCTECGYHHHVDPRRLGEIIFGLRDRIVKLEAEVKAIRKEYPEDFG